MLSNIYTSRIEGGCRPSHFHKIIRQYFDSLLQDNEVVATSSSDSVPLKDFKCIAHRRTKLTQGERMLHFAMYVALDNYPTTKRCPAPLFSVCLQLIVRRKPVKLWKTKKVKDEVNLPFGKRHTFHGMSRRQSERVLGLHNDLRRSTQGRVFFSQEQSGATSATRRSC